MSEKYPEGTPEPGQHPYGQDPNAQNPYGQNPYAQNPYGQNPYGQSPATPSQAPYGQVPYGQSPYGSGYGAPYGMPPADHPQATTVLVLGILGLVVCQVLSPIAWVMGNTAVREIDASGGKLGGRSQANAGRICGIVGTVIVIAAVVLVVGLFSVAVTSSSS